MKRIKESGASYRKKRKLREEEVRKSGSLLKYFGTTSASSTICETASSSVENEANRTDSEEVDSQETVVEASFEIKNLEAASNVVESVSSTDKGGPVAELEESVVPWNEKCLKDAGEWPIKITDDLRTLLVRQTSTAFQHIDCDFAEVERPGVAAKGGARKLTRDWFYRKLPNGEKMLRSWMVYSPSKAALYCFCCRLFGTENNPCHTSGFQSQNGFNKWWKLNPKLEEHESSTAHIKHFMEWKALEVGILRGATIDQKSQEAILSEEKKWRDLLARMLDIIKFLAKQNLAFRGHREHGGRDDTSCNKGNFLELVQLLSKYDPVLREHFTKVSIGKQKSISYMSPKIQNEFINLLGDRVRKQIIQQVKEAKYFCVIFDSTPDISHRDQISQVLRYVKLDGTNVEVVESFVDFVETKGKTAEKLTKLIVEKLQADGLDIQDCRGQSFDNAAVMSGVHSGVQARINAINPKAQFVACTNHSLNLVGVHAASVAINSVTFFETLEKIFAFFSSSTHRWDVLIAATSHGVKRLVETRWSARYDAVIAIKNNYYKLLDVLVQLTDDNENVITRSDAGLILLAIQSFPFLCYLGFWSEILGEINDAPNKGIGYSSMHS